MLAALRDRHLVVRVRYYEYPDPAFESYRIEDIREAAIMCSEVEEFAVELI